MTVSPLGQPNPYSPATVQYATSAPNLGDVVEYAVQRTGLDLRVCLPAKVVTVRGSQFVDVKPLLKQVIYTDTVEYPVITGALVSMPVGADYAITVPIAPGDTGLVVFADRALDAYIQSAGDKPVEPISDRTHNLTDAIFIPGLVPMAKQTEVTSDLVVRNGAAEMRVQKTGAFKIDNGTNELVDLLCQLVQRLTSAQVLTAFGPSPFLASDVLALSQILAKLETLKGS